MASTLKVDNLEGSTGSTVTVPTGQTLTVTDGIGIASIPTITVAKGGTNTTSYTTGDTVYASGATAISKLGIGTARQGLQTNSGASAPEWADSPQSLMTAQGDILYASGANTLAKLAKGSGSDTLKMNSGATAPEWVTVAAATSDVVTVASGAFTTSAIDVADCFTSTYKFYKLFVGGYSVTGAGYMELGFLDSGGSLLTDTYNSIAIQTYHNAWTHTGTQDVFENQDTDGFHLSNTWQQADTSLGQTAEVFFYDPLNTDKAQMIHWISTAADTNPWFITDRGFGTQDTTTAKHGLRFNVSGGTCTAAGHYAVYGYKL